MSYPQFSGYQLGSIVQDIADLETNLGGAINALQGDVAGVVADVDSVKTEVLSIPKSPLKSNIQRGEISNTGNILTINISAINPLKSKLSLYSGAGGNDGAGDNTRVNSFGANSFSVIGTSGTKVYWQIEEFN